MGSAQEDASARGLRGAGVRRLVLGITGGIAAYKTPELVRRLRERDVDVRVVLSLRARQFVTEASLQATGAELVADAGHDMAHIELARWADCVLIAPATAHVLARLASGMADDLLTTTCLATEAPLLLAPAMNRVMWEKPATQANVGRLREQGVTFVGPEVGPQACGETGAGRMSEVATIVEAVERTAAHHGALAGVHALVTAGPTYEALDPVRGFTNPSSGRMGFALAEALARNGATVVLIAGPSALPSPARVRRVDVVSAHDMHEAVAAYRGQIQLFVAAAAVSDYRPESVLTHKLKKGAARLEVTLVPNPDILAMVAAWEPAPFTVGFAAETDDLEAHARDKLRKKRLNLIVANPVGEPGIGFGADRNRVTVIDADRTIAWAAASKTEIARQLADEIAARLNRNPS